MKNVNQKETLEEKRLRAAKVIQLHVAGSAFVAFTPIPFSDAPILLANQAQLVDQILKIYGMNELRNSFNTLITQLGLGFLVSHAAIKTSIYTTSQLLKFIPILGTAAGTIINISLASFITYAYGEAVNNFCYQKALNNTQGVITNDDINNFIKVFSNTCKPNTKLQIASGN